MRRPELVLCLLAAVFGMVAPACAFDGGGNSTQSYCAASSPTTLFVVDRTTTYDAVDSRDLDEGLYAAIVSLNAGDRIVIRTIVDDQFASERVFDGCRPGCLDKSWIGAAVCSELQKKPEVKQFYGVAARSLRELRTAHEDHPRSNIFATIATLANDYRDANLRRVVIFSDLLENSRDISTSMVLREPPRRVLQRLQTLGLSAHFRGTDVLVFGVGRSDAPGRRGLSMAEWETLRAIWTEWFQQGGARSVQIYQWYPKTR